MESFRSPNSGSIGQVFTDGKIQFYSKSLYKHTITSNFFTLEIEHLPKVEMILSYPDANPRLLELLALDKDTKAIILIGLGAGLAASTQENAIWQCVEAGKIVVRASRCNTGEVLPTKSYSSNKILAAGNLSPQKVRILLQLALYKSKDLSQLRMD